MKNTQKLFLIFFLVFGFFVLNAGITDAAITDGLPAQKGGFINLTVFDFSASGNPYLIAGQGQAGFPSFDAYQWNGSSWVDSAINNGLPTNFLDSSPGIFTMGGDWHLITGKTDGTFEGFERSGGAGPWVASTIENGLNPIGGNWSTPTIFPKDGWTTFPAGGKYLITGKADGTFDGYKWGGAGWVPSTIDDSLPDVGHNSTITVFKMGTNWYAITGDGTGQWDSFRWSGGAWVVDTVIDNGLPIHHHNTAPEVFNIGTQYYLIFGERIGRFFGFHWNDAIKSWVAEISDNTPPVVDSLTISDGEETYTGGITTFNTLGNITINATAHDNESGLNDFRIYWYYESAPATVYSSANGAGSGSASAAINLSTHAGDTIHYYAKAVDGNPANEVQSPSWGEWCVNVKAEPAIGSAFSYTNSCIGHARPQNNWHTFIFPSSPTKKYNVTSVSHQWGCGIEYINYQIDSGTVSGILGGHSNTCGVCTSGGFFTHAGGCSVSAGPVQKLKILFKYQGTHGCAVHFRNQLVAGNVTACVPNGGACPGGDTDCCSNHCQNGICCDAGHTCCANDGHCPADSCVDACHLNDHYCDTVADHYCKNNTTHCPIASTACAGGVCAATNTCNTGHCQFFNHTICDQQCDSAGNCIIVINCVDHCVNGAQDCSETGVDCGGACPNPCCTQTCFTGPDCSTVPIANASTTAAFICCGAGESCYDCDPGYSWDGANCTALCAWQDDGCGAHGCNPSTERGESCGPAGCSGGACNPAVTPTQCVGDLNCDCDANQIKCETDLLCPQMTCNGATCWNRGGESSAATCCGDSGDSEHYNYRRDSGGNSCDNINDERCSFGGDDSLDDGCCADSLIFIGSTKCIYNNTCYEAETGIDVDGSGRIGAVCWRGPIPSSGTWADCDFTEDSCQVFGGYAGAYVQSADGAFGEYQDESTDECCGDDADEFLATQGPGIAAHGSKCCNSALTHGLVGDTGSCIECIANGQNDGGNSAWCCSNYSQGGICCKSGTCCTIDSQCGSDACTGNCDYTHPYCDTASGDYNCKSTNESCSAGTHCVGGATPCAPATEICGNDDDEDCDGIALPCCHWQDDGCGKHDCDIWTERGEICMPNPCTGGVGCSPGITQCIEDDLCSTFGLPDRTILEILLDVVDWLLGIIAALAFLMIVIGGTIYLSSSGDVARLETAKKIVTYAIIGLVIAGVSYAVVHVVFDVLQ